MLNNNTTTLRAKCHGFGGLIRVKMFANWGKKFGRTYNFAKSSLFGKIYASFSIVLFKNLPNVTKLLTFVLQNLILVS